MHSSFNVVISYNRLIHLYDYNSCAINYFRAFFYVQELSYKSQGKKLSNVKMKSIEP